MTLPKRHHYLPRSYLRNFANQYGRICIRRRGAQPETTNIINVAAQNHLYSVELPDGSKDRSAEVTLSKYEAAAQPALAQLRSGRIPRSGSDARMSVSLLVALQMTRTPENASRFMFPVTAIERLGGIDKVTPQAMKDYLHRHHLGFEPEDPEVKGAMDLVHGLNAMGLPNPSKDFLDELAPLAKKPVVASIFGGTPEEFATVAGWFAGKVAGFELNLSCPHAEGYGAAIGTDPALVEACTRAVSTSGIPTWVKLTPNVTDIAVIGQAAERGGASALVAINTVKAMRISTALRRPVLGNRFGGLSGSAVFPVAVRCVYELYDAVKIPIIGCGGIASADNVVEMMMAGPRAVEIGSAVQADTAVFEKIRDGLYAKDGPDADAIVGCAHA